MNWIKRCALCVLLCLLINQTAFATLPSLKSVSKTMDDLHIQAVFSPDDATLTVQQDFVLTNRHDNALDAVVLRAYANAFQRQETSPLATEELFEQCYPYGFYEGGIHLTSAHWLSDTQTIADYHYSDDAQTVLTFPLVAPWLPEQTLTLRLCYTVSLPLACTRFGYSEEIYAFANALLIPAMYDEEKQAYHTEPYHPIGESYLSDCANYYVSLTVPQGYQVASSSVDQTPTTQDGQTVYHFVALAHRDFTMAISPFYTYATEEVNGVSLYAYVVDPDRLTEVLGYVKNAFTSYEKRYGDYPYESFTVAEVDFPIGGMEYAGMTFMASPIINEGGETLEHTLVHEVAHQWWFAIVGSNSISDAWQDEALAEYSTLAYYEDVYGEDRRQEHVNATLQHVHSSYPEGLTPSTSVAHFSNIVVYSQLMYARSSAMLCLLNNLVDGKLDEILKSYYHQYAFSFATRADFEKLVQSYSQKDLSSFFLSHLDFIP